MRLERSFFFFALIILLIPPGSAIAEEGQGYALHLIPTDSLFAPLLADPQTPIPSLKYFSTSNHESLIGKIAAGTTFGLVKLEVGRTAVQLNIEGGIFSRFDLYDLVYAETVDYRIGFSLDIAHSSSMDGWALQISPYHTSAHLIDDTIFRAPTTGEINKPADYSRDAVRFLSAYRFSTINRIYAGITFAYDGINSRSLMNYQVGSEFFTPSWILLGREFRFYLADDLQTKEETDWNLNLNLQAGLSVKQKEGQHGLRIAIEYFTGNAVEGQLFEQKEQNIGVAAFFDL